jgi:hypothetical protein
MMFDLLENNELSLVRSNLLPNNLGLLLVHMHRNDVRTRVRGEADASETSWGNILAGAVHTQNRHFRRLT